MPDTFKIFIVEDDATIRTVLELALLGAGYTQITSFRRGDEALDAVRREKPDLILLDLMLPGIDGITLAKRVRETSELAHVRIIMLTARTTNEDIVRGLTAGADDYVTKPFDRLVLLARIAAVLRRGRMVIDGADFDGLIIDSASRSAKLNGIALDLTAGEFKLLTQLVAHRGRIFTRAADERTVDVQIANLRKKLGDWASHIETVRGIGYRVG